MFSWISITSAGTSRLLEQNTQNARKDEQVLVEVQDVNDIPPILQPFDGAITENSPITLITTIKAVDKDASPEFRNVSTRRKKIMPRLFSLQLSVLMSI